MPGSTDAAVRGPLEEYYRAWERRAAALDSVAANISPSDIGVRLGKPMTAEQFAEYRKHRNVQVFGTPAAGR